MKTFIISVLQGLMILIILRSNGEDDVTVLILGPIIVTMLMLIFGFLTSIDEKLKKIVDGEDQGNVHEPKRKG